MQVSVITLVCHTHQDISFRDEPYLQVMLAMAESAVNWRSAAILLATKSGHEVPLANAVNAMTYAFMPIRNMHKLISRSANVKDASNS